MEVTCATLLVPLRAFLKVLFIDNLFNSNFFIESFLDKKNDNATLKKKRTYITNRYIALFIILEN